MKAQREGRIGSTSKEVASGENPLNALFKY
jgi:hypothetical protein